MTARSQPYRLTWPMNPLQIEQLDEMIQMLFDDLRNGTLSIEASQITTNIGTTQIEGLEDAVQGDIIYFSADDTIALLNKDTNTTRYLSNTGTDNNPAWAQVNLTNGVTGDLPYANLTPAVAASTLLGRGSASGGGDWEEIALGDGLTMTGTTLSADVNSGTIASVGYWTPLTDGEEPETDLIYAGGEAIMLFIPTP